MKTPGYHEARRDYNAWVYSLYADAWRSHGKHDPRWDDDAVKLIDDYVRLAEQYVPRRELVARGRKLLAAGLMNGGAQVWDVETAQRPSWGNWRPNNNWIEALAFTSDGRRLASAGADWKVTLWDLPGPKSTLAAPPAAAKWGRYAGLPRHVAFSPDGRWLAIGHDECEIWNVAEGKCVRRLTDTLAAWSPDGRALTTGGGELHNAARIWDAETGELRAKLDGGHVHQLTSLVYSPNDRRVLTGSADPKGICEGVVRCWDAASGEEVYDFSGCVE